MRPMTPTRAPQLDVDTLVRLVLFLNVSEVKVVRLRRLELSRRCQFVRKRKEFVVVASVVEELWRMLTTVSERVLSNLGLRLETRLSNQQTRP